jgi:hypothetical protein
MDLFALIVFGGIAVLLLALVALGSLSRRRVRDITHHGDHEALAARLRIEQRDIPEMVDAQNEYRRRHGRPETTEDEVRRRVGREELDRLDRADEEAKARHRRGFRSG